MKFTAQRSPKTCSLAEFSMKAHENEEKKPGGPIKQFYVVIAVPEAPTYDQCWRKGTGLDGSFV